MEVTSDNGVCGAYGIPQEDFLGKWHSNLPTGRRSGTGESTDAEGFLEDGRITNFLQQYNNCDNNAMNMK